MEERLSLSHVIPNTPVPSSIMYISICHIMEHGLNCHMIVNFVLISIFNQPWRCNYFQVTKLHNLKWLFVWAVLMFRIRAFNIKKDKYLVYNFNIFYIIYPYNFYKLNIYKICIQYYAIFSVGLEYEVQWLSTSLFYHPLAQMCILHDVEKERDG